MWGLCNVFDEFNFLVIVEKWVNKGVFLLILDKKLVLVYCVIDWFILKILWVLVFLVWIICFGMCLWLKWVNFFNKWMFWIRIGLNFFVVSEFWLLLIGFFCDVVKCWFFI